MTSGAEQAAGEVRSARKTAGVAAAIALILGSVYAVEGGYVNDPRDPGGETNHGVTKKVARAAGYTGSMRDFRKHCDQANAVCADLIYTRDYIVAPGFMPIVEVDPAVAEELVDSAVNFGAARPSRWFQQSLNMLNSDAPPVVVDGRVGAASIAAYRTLRLRAGPVQACRLMLDQLDGRQAAEYLRLVTVNPRLRIYYKGWIRARIGNVDRKHCDMAVAA